MSGILSFLTGWWRHSPSAAPEQLGTPRRVSTYASDQKEDPHALFAPGTRIRYDDTLVDRLKDDHQALLNLFYQILDSAKQGRYTDLYRYLDDFRHLFNAHLITENTKLYIYLDKALKPDDSNNEIIHEFRREMNQIGKVVRQFLITWSAAEFDEIQAALFLKEASNIGAVLVKRIETEESRLYEIYQMLPELMS